MPGLNPPQPSVAGGAARPGSGGVAGFPHPGRRRAAWPLFMLGLLANLAVCVPFLFDPWGVLGRPRGDGAVEYVVFLRKAADPSLVTAFFAGRPGMEAVHRGGTFNTLTVRIDGPVNPALEALRAQPFTGLVTPFAGVICH